MRTYVVLLVMLGAFFLELSSHVMIAGKAVFRPLSALAFCALSWRMEFETRMWFALAVGFVMDSVQLIPFGASLVTCVVLALACEVLRFFFSDTESRVTQSIGTGILMLLFLGMAPFWGFVLGRFTS